MLPVAHRKQKDRGQPGISDASLILGALFDYFLKFMEQTVRLKLEKDINLEWLYYKPSFGDSVTVTYGT